MRARYVFDVHVCVCVCVPCAEHADFDGIENLALVLGGEITSTFDDAASVKSGHCKLIEEIMIGEDRLIHFSGER